MKSSTYWFIMPCNLIEFSQCFGVSCCRLLQGWRVNQTGRQQTKHIACENMRLSVGINGLASQVPFLHNPYDPLDAAFLLAYCLPCSTVLKMEATYPSEVLVDFHWTVQHCILEDRSLHY